MENNNNKKKYLWLKNNYKFLITIIGIIITATIAWTSLKAQVNNNSNNITEIKNNFENELKEINDTLNNPEFGLAAIHQRLKALEKIK